MAAGDLKRRRASRNGVGRNSPRADDGGYPPRAMKTDATTVDTYLAALPDDRRAAIEVVRETVLAKLPEGYVEGFGFGMIAYVVPLAAYPNTYCRWR